MLRTTPSRAQSAPNGEQRPWVHPTLLAMPSPGAATARAEGGGVGGGGAHVYRRGSVTPSGAAGVGSSSSTAYTPNATRARPYSTPPPPSASYYQLDMAGAGGGFSTPFPSLIEASGSSNVSPRAGAGWNSYSNSNISSGIAANSGGSGSSGGGAGTNTIDVEAEGWQRDLGTFALMAVLGLLVVGTVVSIMFWPMTHHQWNRLTLPTSIEDVKQIGMVLEEFADEHFPSLLVAHGICYLYLQAFAIPGTIFMNVLSGALLGLKLGFALCQLHNTAGALLLYAQSKWLGKRLVQRYFSKQARQLRSKVKEWKGEVVFRFVFLRMMPVTPNWAVNAISAHLDVTVLQFSAGVFFGLIPYNFLTVKAGVLLKDLSSSSSVIDRQTSLILMCVAVLGFAAPSLLKKARRCAKGDDRLRLPTTSKGIMAV